MFLYIDQTKGANTHKEKEYEVEHKKSLKY